MNLTLTGIMPQAEQAYNNAEAHRELKAMMNRSERVGLFFGIDRYGCEAAYVDSKTTKRFAYQLNQRGFTWLMNYLLKGEVEDFEVNPQDIVKSENADSNKFRKDMLKLFVENDIGKIQFTPEFLDKSGRLTAVATFRKGCINFFFDRDEDTRNYLREKGLIS